MKQLANLLLILLMLGASGIARADLKPDLKPDVDGFRKNVAPLLKQYCSRCHGAKKANAKIRVDDIDPDIITGEHFDRWEDIREAFNTGEMPPKDKPQPTAAERDAMTRWLDGEFKKAKQYGNPIKRGSVRRLTRYELRYALEDLLKTSVLQEVNALPEEGTSVETGLKNNSSLLVVSGPHLEAYLNAILSIIDRMKTIAAFEPHGIQADVANLDVNPPVTFADKGRKNKPPVAKVERTGKGVTVNPGGYIDLRIPFVSRYMFETTITAKSKTATRVLVSLGFQHSEVDPRQKVKDLGFLDIKPGDELNTYSIRSYPQILPDEMSRAIDRPFFVRITNRGRQPFYLDAFDYQGNVNTELVATLIPNGLAESEVDSHVRQSIAAFLQKAFRRSPTRAELAKYNAAYRQYANNDSPIMALLDTYKNILCSPNFFYLGASGNLAAEEAANYKLAERLAFFLWCSVPDEQLLDVATAGNLTTPSVLAEQVDRMLRDIRSKRFVEHFTDQWLETSLLFNVAVDRTYYPRFKDPLKESMRQETLEAVNDVFRNGASALDFLTAEHVFVNQTLAGFYGIKRVRGEEFQKVAIDKNSHRGGLMTQATFLVGNSDGMNSHAILRGVWLAEMILDDPPPDPPANVPPLDENIPGFEKMTLNEKLFAHRNNAACRSCHQRIDPWGIPFENYDASGAWRDKVLVVSKVAAKPKKDPKTPKKKRRKPVFEKTYVEIDRTATLPDGTNIDGIEQLKEYLVTNRRRDFAKGLARRILAYGLSRDLDYHDEDLVDQLVDQFEQSDYSVPTLIRDIVQSESFQREH